jgi:hypothetical protein
VAAAANQQGAPGVNDYSAHADHRLFRVFSSGWHCRFWLLPSRAAWGYIILQQYKRPSPQGGFRRGPVS